jgi:hypothetical protein
MHLEIYNLRLDANDLQKAVVPVYAAMTLVSTTLHIDLTSEVENCAVCSTVLGEGGGKAGLVYVLKDCRCVSCFILMSYRIVDSEKVICGLCVQFPGTPPFLRLFSPANTPTTWTWGGKGRCGSTISSVPSV